MRRSQHEPDAGRLDFSASCSNMPEAECLRKHKFKRAGRGPTQRLRQGDIVTPRIWLGTLLLAGSALQARAEGFDIAITVDDLTAHASLPPGMSWPGIAESYLGTLQAHHVPEAYGFVNAARLKDQPGSEPVLDLWRKAGYPPGNHTYSHLGLSQAASTEAWEDNVKQGEAPIASRMQRADWHYLRY